MKVLIHASYGDLSAAAAEECISCMQSPATPVCCVASGDSPIGLYKELSRRYTQQQLDVSNWYFAGLDEWLGMDGTDEGSCRHMLDKFVTQPLHLSTQQTCFFNGRTKDAHAECLRVEQFIHHHGGLDMAVLGLGLNGHLGLNEPGTPFSARAHVSEISAMTQSVGQKYFSSPTRLTQGITLGLANLMEAQNVVLLVSGERKAEIVKRVIEGNVTEQVPASILQNHPSCSIYLDEAAAKMLVKRH
ncbi:MAG TPA: glucosamine-6-phosphate deaminase [Puia sp.]|jgi:glucosamine-6-phosphate isomerase|nr:glucosamine-6-phosphate deaminase [Puia sp.]